MLVCARSPTAGVGRTRVWGFNTRLGTYLGMLYFQPEKNMNTQVTGDRETVLAQMESYEAMVRCLKRGRKEDMKQCYDKVVVKWLQSSVTDEPVRPEVNYELKKMVDQISTWLP